MQRPRSVLIVDDDAGIRAVLEYNLEEADHAVAQAASAEEGWTRFLESPPDLVITDVRMAGMTGLDLLRKIKEHSPDVPVIVITAYGDVAQAVEAMKRGAYDYIPKPFDRDALKLTVRKALEYTTVRRENIALRSELAGRFGLSSIVGRSPPMQALFRTVAKVAPTETTVLIQGETGTGKELVARAIHYGSARASRNFVTVNCAAIPRELLESELFGYVKGAFTGATASKTGKFELANEGTIFLDEIGDVDLELQKKLLRVLQEREIDKVGATSPIRVDVRVIAATNQRLAQMVETGNFRKDLYYRLNVVPVVLPPLRDRKEDISLLVEHFLEKFGAREVQVEEGALEKLLAHHWAGNVRELENTLERALILSEKDGRITARDITFGESSLAASALAPTPEEEEKEQEGREIPGSQRVHLPEDGLVLDDLERDLIQEALARTGGNQSAAARLLGISRQTLIYRMQKHGIRSTPER